MKNLYTAVLLLFVLQLKAAPPTIPTSNLNFPQVDGGYFNIAWTAGNGTRRVIICKAGSPVTFIPQNGADYTENTVFGSGQQVAPGEFVIYDNAFTSFFLTNLTPATQYFFAVFEYNGTGAATEYLTSGFLTGSAFTAATPSLQVSNAVFSNITTNSVNINWTNGNGQRRLVVVRQGAPVNADPVMSHPYAVNAAFGNGEQIGTGNFTLYASSGTGTSVTNLQPGMQYFFSFYEFNGSSQPQYKIPAFTASVTTRSVPTIAASNLVISKADGKELDLAWTNGNGQRRIIVCKKGSAITGVPVDGTDYAANSIFGQGSQLGAGEYVVFDDNFNEAAITGLDPASLYFFKIFEYDGSGSTTAYLTASFASISGSTAVTPTLQASNLTTNNITGTSLKLSFTNGNGRARIIIARKNAAVNTIPENFTTYIDNGAFGNGQDMGNGNFVISAATANNITVTNLEPNTTYHFAVFEFNGFNQPLYLSPAIVANATTLGTVPVTLGDWRMQHVQNKVKLLWTTLSEINYHHFEIEKSDDAIHYLNIGNVLATGSNNIGHSYFYNDPENVVKRTFYRLKMVDNDGRFTYSTILTVDPVNEEIPSVRGTIVHDQLEVMNIGAGQQAVWQIINAAGQIVSKGKIVENWLRLNLSNLSAGIYWLRYTDRGKLKSIPFIKQ